MQRVKLEKYQQGVPTKVILERCLSPVSNIHADTPKSPSLIVPFPSTKIFPACNPVNEVKDRIITSNPISNGPPIQCCKGKKMQQEKLKLERSDHIPMTIANAVKAENTTKIATT